MWAGFLSGPLPPGAIRQPRADRQMTVAAGIVAAIVLASPGITGLEITKGSRVRLLSDEISFRKSFRRFPNDELNGLSPAQLNRLGQEVEILETYPDETVKCKFDDGVQYDMPIEALGIHATALKANEPKGAH